MKTIVKILPLLLIFACGGPKNQNATVEKLISKRDSLQTVEFEITKQINSLNAEIASLDTHNTADELQLIKKIAMQKNKVVGMSKKLKKLENQLASLHQEKVLVPVAVKEIHPELFTNYIVVYGNVEADKYAQISPEMNGRVKTIHVNEGQKVSKGQLLVSLNTDAIDNQIKGTQSSLDFVQTSFQKQDTLWKQGIGSEIQYLSAKNNLENLEAQLETLEAQLRMSQIRAPFDGVVDKIFPKKGEMAGPSFPVVEFVSLDKMNIKAEISERYISQVKKGQMVDLTFSSIPDFSVQTPIIRTTKVINSSSRTFEIELTIPNKGKMIMPNMVSTIKINVFENKDAMVVPSLAIRNDISGSYVYVAKEKEGELVVEKRPIKTSLSYQENTLVTSGLDWNDKVITKGYHLVSAGMAVNIVE
jgi:RND family efflux transporter MFP subunit